MIALINLLSKIGRLVLLSGFVGFLLVSCGTGGTSKHNQGVRLHHRFTRARKPLMECSRCNSA